MCHILTDKAFRLDLDCCFHVGRVIPNPLDSSSMPLDSTSLSQLTGSLVFRVKHGYWASASPAPSWGREHGKVNESHGRTLEAELCSLEHSIQVSWRPCAANLFCCYFSLQVPHVLMRSTSVKHLINLQLLNRHLRACSIISCNKNK